MYNARNTMESAIHDAVEAVLRGSKPGLYPYMGGSQGGHSHLNPSQGASKKADMEGYFKQPVPLRAKRPFKAFAEGTA